MGIGGTFGAQTFTAGTTGFLVTVDVLLGANDPLRPPPRPEWLILEIRSLRSDGLPGDSILAASAVNRDYISGVEHWETMDLDTAVRIQESDVLAIVVRSVVGDGNPGSLYFWRMTVLSDSDRYPLSARYVSTGGWTEAGGDFGFRTYVSSVPEPSAAVLMMLGLAMLPICRSPRPDRESENSRILLHHLGRSRRASPG